jgi:ABC-type transport system involved in cytochrome bd biosynthesis fused ATPase/permease subunit
LLSMMDEMVSHSGTKVRKNGSIAYISQEAFLSNETIQNNITFAKKFEK